MRQAIRIIGIDPGLRRTGWGVVESLGSRLSFVAAGTIAPSDSLPLAARLCAIYDELREVMGSFAPHEAAVEATFVNRDAVATLKLGQARGIALLVPAKAGVTVAEYAPNLVLGLVTGAMTKLLGTQLLSDVQTFVSAMDTMFGGLRERAESTAKLLRTPGTAFVVVASPEPDALREASYFVERLIEDDLPLAGVVVNRVHRSAIPKLSASRSVAAAEQLEADAATSDNGNHNDNDTGRDARVAAAVLRIHARRMQVSASEEAKLDGFRLALPAVRMATVPAFADDVHDVAGLRALAESVP